MGLGNQILEVLVGGLVVDLFDEFDRSGEGNGAFDVGGAGFEFGWEVGESGAGFVDDFDHAAAGLVGVHFFEVFFFCVKDADAGGAEDFVAGESEKIAVEFLDVDFFVGDELSCIDEFECFGLGNLWFFAGDIGHAGDGEEI